MVTQIIKESLAESAEKALAALRNGEIIAVPTDTVYGIACLVNRKASIQRLFAIKKRDQLKAIPVLIGSLDQVNQVARGLQKYALTLADTFWPGALTLIVKKHGSLPEELTVYDTVGVRMPDHTWLRSLILRSGPIAATSANISGEPSLSTAEEVLRSLDGKIDLLIDGGSCPGGIASTVVDCSTEPVKILREGGIPKKDIFSALTNKSNNLEKK